MIKEKPMCLRRSLLTPSEVQYYTSIIIKRDRYAHYSRIMLTNIKNNQHNNTLKIRNQYTKKNQFVKQINTTKDNDLTIDQHVKERGRT